MIEVRKRSRLPHWHSADAPYFVTWNLVDAFPVPERQRIETERLCLIEQISRERGVPTPAELHEIRQMILRRIETVLDRGHGECLLIRPEFGQIVSDSLTHFEGDRYRLLDWSVMPNHVHVVFCANAPNSLDSIVKGWKGFTARTINRVLGRTGSSVWQEDYFDRLIRSRDHLLRTIRYVDMNPIKAGLQNWPWTRCYPERFRDW